MENEVSEKPVVTVFTVELRGEMCPPKNQQEECFLCYPGVLTKCLEN